MSRLLVCTALGVEARALRSEGTEVAQVGLGPRRAAASVRLLSEFDALVVAGFGGATVSSLRPGDVVVASEVRREGKVIPCPWAAEVARLVERALRAGPDAVLVPTYDAIAGRTASRSAAYNAGYGVGHGSGSAAGYAAGHGTGGARGGATGSATGHGAAPGCSAPLAYQAGGRAAAGPVSASGAASSAALSTASSTASSGGSSAAFSPATSSASSSASASASASGWGAGRFGRDREQQSTALRDRPLPVATPPAISPTPDPDRPAVVTGPVETLDRVASRATLARLAALGVCAVDMEAYPLAEAAAGRPFAVVRVVVDNPDHPLLRPSTIRASFPARHRLRALGPALRAWAADLDRDGER